MNAKNIDAAIQQLAKDHRLGRSLSKKKRRKRRQKIKKTSNLPLLQHSEESVSSSTPDDTGIDRWSIASVDCADIVEISKAFPSSKDQEKSIATPKKVKLSKKRLGGKKKSTKKAAPSAAPASNEVPKRMKLPLVTHRSVQNALSQSRNRCHLCGVLLLISNCHARHGFRSARRMSFLLSAIKKREVGHLLNLEHCRPENQNQNQSKSVVEKLEKVDLLSHQRTLTRCHYVSCRQLNASTARSRRQKQLLPRQRLRPFGLEMMLHTISFALVTTGQKCNSRSGLKKCCY